MTPAPLYSYACADDLPVQLARGTKKRKKGKGPSKRAPRPTPLRTGQQQRQQEHRSPPQHRRQQHVGSTSSSSSRSSSGAALAGSAGSAGAAGAARATAAAASASASNAGNASHPTARRTFKRPRMIHTSSSSSHVAPPPPPPPSAVPPPGRYGNGRYDVRLDDDGGRAGGGRGGGGRRSTATSPRLPAASDVRLGQSEAQALVQRLRRVARRERERRATSTVSGAGTGRGGEPRVPLEVEATMEELRRVAVRGDATTLDVLLSSQVRVGSGGRGGGLSWVWLVRMASGGGGGSGERTACIARTKIKDEKEQSVSAIYTSRRGATELIWCVLSRHLAVAFARVPRRSRRRPAPHWCCLSYSIMSRRTLWTIRLSVAVRLCCCWLCVAASFGAPPVAGANTGRGSLSAVPSKSIPPQGAHGASGAEVAPARERHRETGGGDGGRSRGD